MIHLSKLEEPQILKDNKEKWTSHYLRLVNNGQDVPDDLKYKYRDASIKEQIIKETHNKCAYCESKVTHVCPGDVEHILPKNKNARPDLYLEWTNLTLACEQCNRPRKRDYYNASDPLIHPYKDIPEEHLMSAGPMIFGKPGDRKGFITNSVLDLNRSSLLERRTERLKSISLLVESWGREQNPAIKDVLENELKKEAAPDKEYSFVVKTFLSSMGIAI